MNYEFLDDSYSALNGEEENILTNDDREVCNWEKYTYSKTIQIWQLPERQEKLQLYFNSPDEVQQNHPLNIMAKEKRAELLGHPLCRALVRHKWNNFGQYVFYFNLIYYSVFVGVFTEYMQSSPRPYNPEQLIAHAKDPK